MFILSSNDYAYMQWRSVERLGATVVLKGDSYDEAQAYAKLRGEQEGRTFIPPFDHPDVIAGQGTVGMEIIRQLNSDPIHAIFVPVGGGGLIAGIAAYVKRVRPEVCAFLLPNSQILTSFPKFVFTIQNNLICPFAS
jgi:threonine dehydratase